LNCIAGDIKMIEQIKKERRLLEEVLRLILKRLIEKDVE